MYVVDEFSDEPIMLIDRHIGMDETEGMGIDGSLFQRELLYLDSLGKKRIQVWINSPGGIVVDGYNIYNAILKTKTKVDTYCIGIAASIAAVIFQAGRNRIMADYSILMYHNPFGGDSNDGLEAMRNSIVTMIATRSGMDEAKVAEIMARETFLSSQEALDLKLCDNIEVSADMNKKRLAPVANDARGYWKESNVILNSIFNKQPVIMKKVYNKLNLVDGSNEDAVIASIEAIENKAKVTAEDLEKCKKEMAELKDKYDKMKAEYDKLEKDAKDKEEKDKSEKAKNLVAGAAKAGKIKNDATVIAGWEKKAVEDFDGTKALLESITSVKNAVKIEDAAKAEGENGNTEVIENAVAQDMLRIRNKFTGNAAK